MDETTNAAEAALEANASMETEESAEELGDGYLYAQINRGGER